MFRETGLWNQIKNVKTSDSKTCPHELCDMIFERNDTIWQNDKIAFNLLIITLDLKKSLCWERDHNYYYKIVKSNMKSTYIYYNKRRCNKHASYHNYIVYSVVKIMAGQRSFSCKNCLTKALVFKYFATLYLRR